MIRGKKNYLPPHPLIMGFGILFRLDESSLGSHLNERRVRGDEEGTDDTEQFEPFQELSDSGSDSEKEVSGGKESGSSAVNLSSERPLRKVLSPGASSRCLESDVAIKQDISDQSTASGISAGNDKELDSSSKTAAVMPDLQDLIDRALELGPATSAKNYGRLQSSHGSVVEESNHEKSKAVQRDKPYVTKAERRKLKKGQKDDAVVPGEHGNEAEGNHDPLSHPDEDRKIPKSGIGKTSRGQRGKLKKIKEKYADQDEEERNIRMALLGVSIKLKTGHMGLPNYVCYQYMLLSSGWYSTLFFVRCVL